MPAKIQLRRDSTANWAANTLAAGEVGLEIESNTVIGVKVGGNVTPTAWSSLEYLEGTFPKRSSASTDLNAADFRKNGRFSFSSALALTNGPITFVASDGAAHLLTTLHGVGHSAIQFLATEGDGTATYPSKFYQRVYDDGAAAWRSWQPTTNWAFDASTGTPIACTTFEAKGQATFADGTVSAPAITNNGDTNTGVWFPADDTVAVATNGTEAIRFNSNQQALFRDGTNALPAVSNHDDTDTGMYFSNANEISFATNGVQRALIDATGLLSIVGNLSVGGNLDMTTGTISNVVDPTNAQDAVTKNYLEANRIGQIAIFSIEAAGVIGFQRAGTQTSVFSFSGGNALTNLRSSLGTWTGYIVGTSGFARYTIDTGNSTLNYNASLGAASGVWAVFVRTA